MKAHLQPCPPVIVLASAAGQGAAALDLGADDYVTKPLREDVLVARTRALLRRAYGRRQPTALETYRPFVFDVAAGRISKDGTPIETTAKEFALTLMLFRNLGRPLSREYLTDAIWGHGAKVVSRTLDVHVSKVRLRLGLELVSGLRLSSIYGFGYRLDRLDDAATSTSGAAPDLAWFRDPAWSERLDRASVRPGLS